MTALDLILIIAAAFITLGVRDVISSAWGR